MLNIVNGNISAIFLTTSALAFPSLVGADDIARTFEQHNATVTTENVQLHSHDGTVSMTGRLLAYTEDRYEFETALGVLVVSANAVWCEGAACPEPI